MIVQNHMDTHRTEKFAKVSAESCLAYRKIKKSNWTGTILETGQRLRLQPIRTAIEPGCNPPQPAGITADGFVAHTLQFQGPKELAVQLVETFLLGFVHGRLLEKATRFGTRQGLHRINGVFYRVAASFSQWGKRTATTLRSVSAAYPGRYMSRPI